MHLLLEAIRQVKMKDVTYMAGEAWESVAADTGIFAGGGGFIPSKKDGCVCVFLNI